MKTLKTLKIIGMVPLVLIAANSFGQGSDERAVPRGSGGGSSSAGSAAGSRHSGGSSDSGSSSASSASSNSGSSASQGGGNFSAPVPDAAQRRPRPGTGTGDRGRYGTSGDRYIGAPNSYYYYDPYFYGGFSGRYGRSLYGYGYGYYDYGYGYGDYYGYYPSSSVRSYRYRTGNIAQLRTLVEPVKTRVYVDGYYAGIADDFDGLLQRLNVSPGRHDITLRLEGYNSHTFAIYANRDQTIKLRWDMVRGSGETRDSIGEDRSEREAERDREIDRDAGRGREADRADRPSPRGGARGELVLDIDPDDASVYVDGEFYGKASQVTSLDLPAGRHRIEVVRPGYRTEETDVEVGREATKVTVRLEKR